MVAVKPIVKALPKLFGSADGKVRDAAKALAIEAYRWAGSAILSALKDIKPVQLNELQSICEGLKDTPVATRFIAKEKAAAAADARIAAPAETPDENSSINHQDSGNDAHLAAVGEQGGISAAAAKAAAYDFADPVEIKIPATFSEGLCAAKWSDRKEVLELFLKAVSHPKL